MATSALNAWMLVMPNHLGCRVQQDATKVSTCARRKRISTCWMTFKIMCIAETGCSFPGTDSGHLNINIAWPVSRATTDAVALLWACRMARGVLRSLQVLQ
eukprot:5174878-Pleurochrysis_carterae.AAC.6